MAYERIADPLAPRHVFIGRVVGNLFLVLLFLAVSLGAGMAGYRHFLQESWIDAFADAAMILSGMGPLNDLTSDEGKLFAGIYALYSGVFFIFAAGLILAPIAHRLLHSLHADDD